MGIEAVLTDMTYNLGKAGIESFHTFISDIKAHEWSAAASDARDSLWCRQVGSRCPAKVAPRSQSRLCWSTCDLTAGQGNLHTCAPTTRFAVTHSSSCWAREHRVEGNLYKASSCLPYSLLRLFRIVVCGGEDVCTHVFSAHVNRSIVPKKT